MNPKFNKIFGSFFIVLLITICLSPAMAESFPQKNPMPGMKFEQTGHHPPILGIWQNPKIVEKLELTKDQIKQLREEYFTFREKALGLKAGLDGLHLKMEKAFSNDIVDHEAVLKIANSIADIKGKLFINVIESRLMLGKLLNTDQMQELKLYIMNKKTHGQVPTCHDASGLKF